MAVFVRLFCRVRLCDHAFLLSCFFALLILGLWRFSLSEIKLQSFPLRQYYDQEVLLAGRVVSDPQTIDKKTQFKLGEIKLKDASLGGRALVTIYNRQGMNFGDGIYLRCDLQRPERIEEFDYGRFLAKDDIVALCRQGEVLALEKFDRDWLGQPWRSLNSSLLEFKSSWRELFIGTLPTDEGSLLSGIMLGDGYLMGKDLKDAYSRSGLSHLVAISGMNMTMIAVFLLWLLVIWGLWRRQASLAAVALIWLYTLAIGWPSSAVRASVMSSLVLLAYALGRLAQAERLLALSACLMLALNPRLLRDDVGFQLSFLAFLSLVWYYEPLRDFIGKYNTNKYLQLPLEIISLTLAAQVLTWPILAYNFAQVSAVAPLANLLVLWALGPLMIMSLLGSVLSIAMPAAWSLAPAYFLAHWLNATAIYFGNLPFSAIAFGRGGLHLFILYYCGIMFITLRSKLSINAQDTVS